MVAERMAVTSHPFLSAAECTALAERIFALREHWIPRAATPDSEHLSCKVFTIGVAAYLDAAGSVSTVDRYHCRLEESNAFLALHFGDLLERTRDLLERTLQAPVRFGEELALPGFHIFIDYGIPVGDDRHAHYDRQYLHLRWPENTDFTRPVSFTLPIMLPEVGGGLDTWGLSPEDLESGYRRGLATELQVYKDRWPVHRYGYSAGALVLQYGHILHRIAPIPRIKSGDYRITLQGHMLLIDGVWRLYW